MITLTEIHKNNAEFVTNSGFELNHDTAFQTLSLENSDGEGVFFQDWEYSDMMEKINEVYNECGDIGLDIATLSVLMPYIECVGH